MQERMASTNGVISLERSYTALGVGIGKRGIDLAALNTLNPDATGDEVMYALAKYVPAVSSPVGGRFVFCDALNENFNLVDGKYRANGWCRPYSDDSSLWKHSDIKDAAYFYIYKLYEEIIQKGTLK